MTFAGTYLFLLGLASGIGLLALTAYRRVSPHWLRWLLMASGVFVMSRYLTMALFTMEDAPVRWPLLRHCWYASTVGLTLPSVMAIDQLVRHPAMTPRKLLTWFSPFLLIYAGVIWFGPRAPLVTKFWIPGMGGGFHWLPGLGGFWRLLLIATQTVFVIGFVAIAVSLVRRLPVPRLRRALLGLVLAQLALGLDGLSVLFAWSYFRPFLYSEILASLALWYAYETSAALQSSSS